MADQLILVGRVMLAGLDDDATRLSGRVRPNDFVGLMWDGGCQNLMITYIIVSLVSRLVSHVIMLFLCHSNRKFNL